MLLAPYSVQILSSTPCFRKPAIHVVPLMCDTKFNTHKKVKIPRNRNSTLFDLGTLEGGGWSAPRSSRFTAGKTRYPLYRRVGWAPGPIWTYAKNLAPTGIRSPDRPARSQSLYRLSYPSPHTYREQQVKKVKQKGKLSDIFQI
jgi:hypothetical protein